MYLKLTLKRLRQVVESYEDGTVMAGVRENYKRNRDAYLAAKNKMDADLKLDVTQFTDLVEINNETIDVSFFPRMFLFCTISLTA